ncbi:MAG: excinuclease ABC subunit C [Candidatus Scalindua rubra]|uniref:UvrABC system protein C n=1 Tax=Candidatus Scalindua rubra TaxID=1872076 RepID=A0A1E3X6Q6_9BACT|nr:MAG: excinuclease ABC subunit C [Candidatus Scalindua rubra]
MIVKENTKLSKKLEAIPTNMGVYLMKDSKNEVIYVGKAKNLKNRVRSYFQSSGDERLFVSFLVKRIADIDFVLTDTEKEALILENNLIKQFKPRFNINLRDDKTFVSIKLDLNQKFPYPVIVRQIESSSHQGKGTGKKNGVLYFGPYSSARAVRETLGYVNSLFPIRKCSNNVFKSRVRPCLYYQIGKCVGPCCDLVDEKTYKELLNEVILVLKGKNEELLEVLRKKMNEASKAQKYEKAAKFRDRIMAIEKTVEKQKISTMEVVDRDVFGYYGEGNSVQIQAMFIRGGNLEDIASYRFSTMNNTVNNVFRSFLNQFYIHTRFIPDEIVMPVESEDKEILEELLSEKKGHKIKVVCPKRGEKHKLLEMAIKNAENAFKIRQGTGEDIESVMVSLKKHLGLTNIPKRMECFDISNIRGKQAVGSMVTFENGKPVKSRYKRYKVKTVSQSDDYAMMYEVLTRRYSRAFREDDFPDITIMDGGKGQLGIARRVFDELGTDRVDIIALAKSKRKDTRGADAKQKMDERVFVCDKASPIVLNQESSELRLLVNIRDEAHRFALAYHKKLRKKQYYESPLDRISGIGKVKKKDLLKHFGDMQKIRNASLDELENVKSITSKDAKSIYDYFHYKS